MNNHEKKRLYSLDILRLLAVLIFLLGHTPGLNIFNIGVSTNIFLLISGYLFCYNFDSINNLSLKEFILKRIKTTYPKLIIGITLFFLIYLLLFDIVYLLDISKSYLSNIFLIHNFYLFNINSDYFSEHITNPFLNLWAVNYILQITLLFYLIFKFIFKIQKIENNINSFFKILTIIIFLFALDYMISSDNYYHFANKVWVFPLGILSFWISKKLNYEIPLYSYLGLISAILTSVILIIPTDIFYRNYYVFNSLSVILFSIILSLIRINKNYLVIILDRKFLRKLSEYSYHIIIIHLPIWLLIKLYEPIFPNPLGAKIFLLFLTYIFSVFLFIFLINFLEENIKIIFKKCSKILLILFALFIFAFLISNKQAFKNFIKKYNFYNFYTSLFFEKYGNSYFPNWHTIVGKNDVICHNMKLEYDQIENCFFEYNDNNKNLYLLSTSVGSTLGSYLKEYSLQNNLNYYHLTNSHIYLHDAISIDLKSKIFEFEPTEDRSYSEKRDAIQSHLMENEGDLIIIHADLDKIINQYTLEPNIFGIEKKVTMDYYMRNINPNISLDTTFSKTVYDLLANNHKVIIIYPIPNPIHNVPKKIKNNILINKDFIYDVEYEKFLERNKNQFKIFDSLNHKNLYKVYPHKIFCNTEIENRCIFNDHENIFYSDHSHPSVAGSKLISKKLIKLINEIYK